MGSGRNIAGSRAALGVAVAAVVALALGGCSSDAEPEQATVTPANAYAAIVRWEVEQNEPVIDDDGNIEAPVIYLAAGSGGTVDVRVQADVISDIDDAAVIRFADDARDARDVSLDNEPIKDDGVMILVDEFEPDQAQVDARVVRYRSIDDDHAWILQVIATASGAEVASATIAAE